MSPLMLDTNVVLRLARNPQAGRKIKKMSEPGVPVYVCDIVLDEAESKGVSRMKAMRGIQQGIGSIVATESVSRKDRKRGKVLERKDMRLHSPDSILAAFAERKGCTLVTYDRALYAACTRVGIPCIEPP